MPFFKAHAPILPGQSQDNQETRNRLLHPSIHNPCFHNSSQSWATSLPPDVGYDELVDIRTVQAPWPTPSSYAGRERRFDFGDGSTHNQGGSSVERNCPISNREFDSDEASLWWYTNARMEGPHAMGLPHEVSSAEFDGGNKSHRDYKTSVLCVGPHHPVLKFRLRFRQVDGELIKYKRTTRGLSEGRLRPARPPHNNIENNLFRNIWCLSFRSISCLRPSDFECHRTLCLPSC